MDPQDPDRGLSAASDAIVAGRAADGDLDAFEVLVRRHAPMMRAYARRILAATDEVDDVVQESWMVAWKQLPELNDPSKVRGWLMRVLSRKALDRVRVRRYHSDITQIEVASPRPAPAQLVEQQSALSGLTAALAELDDNQRQVWILREWAGYSYDEIAADLNLSRSTVRGMLARARKKIVDRMEGWR